MKRIINKIAEWLKMPSKSNRKRLEKLAEQKFNIVNYNHSSYLTYDNVRITNGMELDTYLVELMFVLREQFVEDHLK